ncbi:unnamed protein product, partial [Prorocentrum cordatum]
SFWPRPVRESARPLRSISLVNRRAAIQGNISEMTLRVARWAALATLAACVAGDDEAQCQVDPTDACRCILRGSVFSDIDGCDPAACDNPTPDLRGLVDSCAEKAKTKESPCDQIGDLMGCAREMGCVDRVVQQSCQHIVKTQSDCNVDCGGAAHAAGIGLLPVLVMSLAASRGLQA